MELENQLLSADDILTLLPERKHLEKYITSKHMVLRVNDFLRSNPEPAVNTKPGPAVKTKPCLVVYRFRGKTLAEKVEDYAAFRKKRRQVKSYQLLGVCYHEDKCPFNATGPVEMQEEQAAELLYWVLEAKMAGIPTLQEQRPLPSEKRLCIRAYTLDQPMSLNVNVSPAAPRRHRLKVSPTTTVSQLYYELSQKPATQKYFLYYPRVPGDSGSDYTMVVPSTEQICNLSSRDLILVKFSQPGPEVLEPDLLEALSTSDDQCCLFYTYIRSHPNMNRTKFMYLCSFFHVPSLEMAVKIIKLHTRYAGRYLNSDSPPLVLELGEAAMNMRASRWLFSAAMLLDMRGYGIRSRKNRYRPNEFYFEMLATYGDRLLFHYFISFIGLRFSNCLWRHLVAKSRYDLIAYFPKKRGPIDSADYPSRLESPERFFALYQWKPNPSFEM